jgi:hypothetical protein
MKVLTALVFLVSCAYTQSVGDFVAPLATDARSPCPALNTLANHGYINRNGRNITRAELSVALRTVYGLEDTAVSFFTQVVAPGIPINNAEGHLELGQLGFRNFLEHDASLVHDDVFFGPTNVVNQTKLNEMLSLQTLGKMSLTQIATHKANQWVTSQLYNPTYGISDTPVPQKSLGQYMEPGSVWAIFGESNNTLVDIQTLKSFFGEERLPATYVLPTGPRVSLALIQSLALQIKSLALARVDPKLSIPSAISATAMTVRNAYLASQKTKIVNGPVYITIANQPGRLWKYAQGPQPAPYWANAAQTGLMSVGARSNFAGARARALIAEKLLSGAVPIATLDDLTNMFQNFSSAIRVPPGLTNWQTDEAFGEDRLTWGGYKLSCETSNVLRISDQLARNITGMTVADLIRNRRLFKVDYSTLGMYSKTAVGQVNPFGQYVPSTYGQFFLNSRNRLMPLAIRVVESGLVYTPRDTPNDWMFAKLAFSASEGFYMPLEHFTVPHMVLLGAQTELIREVSPHHPVYALLSHHMTDNYGNVVLGQQLLLQNGTAFDTCFGSGGVGASEFLEDRYTTFHYNDLVIGTMFTRAGTSLIPGYKYRDDLLAIHSAYLTFVTSYLRLYYSSDTQLAADREIRAWAAAVADPAKGGLVGFPTSFRTISQLANALTNIIVSLSALHGVLNGAATWDGQTFPLRPRSLYGAVPTAKNQVVNARQHIAPNAQLILADVALNAGFLIPVTQANQLGYSYEGVLGPRANPALATLQTALTAISTRIQAREAASIRKFTIMDPVNIPYQVWI